MVQKIVQMEARQVEQTAALQDARAQVEAHRVTLQNMQQHQGSSTHQQLLQALGSQTVDTRTLGKPQNFAGRRDQWRHFRSVFRAFAITAHPSMPELFQKAESMADKPISTVDMDDVSQVTSRHRYYMLVMLTGDDARQLIQNVEAGDGAEA